MSTMEPVDEAARAARAAQPGEADGGVTGHELAAADAAALEALLEAEWDLAKVKPEQRERAERVARVLGLLDVQGVDASRDGRISDAQARVTRLESAALSPDDEETVDAWVLSGYRASRVASDLRERAARHEALAELIAADVDVSGREERIERVLAAVEADAELPRSLKFGAVRDEYVPSRRVRMGDLVSVAAVIAIGSAVVWPMLTAAREQARRMACASNMQAAATAFGSYAGMYRDQLPMATAGLSGTGFSAPWWQVGKPQHSNSANLFTLAREGFLTRRDLACPGNPSAPRDVGRVSPEEQDWSNFEQVSYSYQIMFGPERPVWNATERTVVITDRSPVVKKAVRGLAIDPFENSGSHGGAGQCVLFTDGSSEWVTSPVLAGGDNIWLPRSLERVIAEVLREVARREGMTPIRGTEVPESADDAFVGP